MFLCDICTHLYVEETDLVPGGLLQLYIEIKVLLTKCCREGQTTCKRKDLMRDLG